MVLNSNGIEGLHASEIPQRAEYIVDEHPLGEPRKLRVITIGAGFSGLNIAYQIGKHMKNVDLQLYEKNEEVGGTWLENKYPGCACDIPSHCYQYTWAPNPNWSKFYAPASEILEYIQDTATRYNLRENIKFKHEVISAIWDEGKGIWNFKMKDLQSGGEIEDYCHFFINASGYLNNWKWPSIPGLHSFEGTLMHSAAWNSEVDLNGKTVAVLGSGSSGIQIVPTIQPHVKHLTTFIRSPTWITAGFAQKFSGPGGKNFDFTVEQKREFFENSGKYLSYRKEVESQLNSRFKMLHKDTPEQAEAVRFSTADMKAKLGDSPIVDWIIPKFAVGCRRPTPGAGYLEALTKENVRVVNDEIQEIVPEGLLLVTGEKIEIDMFICATGFDVSFCPRFPIIGKNGVNLAEQWKERPTSYLSMAPDSIPNYFMFMGPNSPVGHGSALPIIEHVTKYILKMLYKAQTENIKSFSPSSKAIEEFTAHADVFLERTAWSSKCRSWFKNGRIDGPVTALHPGSRLHWFHMMANPRYEDWEWSYFSQNRFAYLGNGFTTQEKDGKDLTYYFDNPDAGYESFLY